MMKRQRKLQEASKVKGIKPKRMCCSLVAIELCSLMLFAIFSAVLIPSSDAATHSANSCNTTDVQNAITAAAEGDTVLIPNGSCTWSASVTLSGKGIILLGAKCQRRRNHEQCNLWTHSDGRHDLPYSGGVDDDFGIRDFYSSDAARRAQ